MDELKPSNIKQIAIKDRDELRPSQYMPPALLYLVGQAVGFILAFVMLFSSITMMISSSALVQSAGVSLSVGSILMLLVAALAKDLTRFNMLAYFKDVHDGVSEFYAMPSRLIGFTNPYVAKNFIYSIIDSIINLLFLYVIYIFTNVSNRVSFFAIIILLFTYIAINLHLYLLPFVIAEDIESGYNQNIFVEIVECWQMMDGYCWALFKLLLSFIGWFILSGMTWHILDLWVQPKLSLSLATFYNYINGGDDKEYEEV